MSEALRSSGNTAESPKKLSISELSGTKNVEELK
jgi:hypothetical protein